MSTGQRILTIIALFLLICGYFGSGVIGAAGQPGSEEDPLVTRSWVDRYLNQEFSPAQKGLSSLETQLFALNDQVKKMESSLLIILTIGQARAQVGNQVSDLEVPPFIVSGRTYLPLRFIGEAFGTDFQWDGDTKKITYQSSQGMVELVIGANTAKIGDDAVQLDAPAMARCNKDC